MRRGTDAIGLSAALATTTFAWAASRTPSAVPSGPPLALGVPDESWVVEGQGTASFEGDRAVLRAGPCAPGATCRTTMARDLDLPDQGRWIVDVDLERLVAADRNRVFLLDPATGWHAGRGAFVVGGAEHGVVEAVAGAGSVRVGLMARGDGESVAVGPVSVTPARRSWVQAAWWWGTIVAATGGAVLAATEGWRALDRVGRAALIALGVAFLAGVMAPREWLDAAFLAIPGVRPEDLQAHLLEDPTLPIVLQKLGGHGLGFALLGALGARAAARFELVGVRLLAFAVATEALQLLLPGRSGRWQDVVLDLCGGLLGYVLTRVVAPRAPRASSASRP
ncbi:MAG: VanZ family protein [Myxococcales bacterium]|nr:VanZ family protein [Myxococcales bacterium]